MTGYERTLAVIYCDNRRLELSECGAGVYSAEMNAMQNAMQLL